jgi:hypothetical protein
MIAMLCIKISGIGSALMWIPKIKDDYEEYQKIRAEHKKVSS